jgi:CRP-like cAMP-binding protein
MAEPQASILDQAPGWIVRHSAGQVIFHEGDRSTNMYRLESGCVRLQVNGQDGNRQIIAFLFAGDLFGFQLSGRVYSAEAVTDVVLRCWPIQAALQLEGRSGDVAVELINASNTMFAGLAQHLVSVTRLSASDRLLWFFQGLLRCRGLKKPSGVIELPMSRRDIADYLSLTPETLSRAIADLEGQDYVQRSGRRRFLVGPRAHALNVRALDEQGVDGEKIV